MLVNSVAVAPSMTQAAFVVSSCLRVLAPLLHCFSRLRLGLRCSTQAFELMFKPVAPAEAFVMPRRVPRILVCPVES